MPIMESKRLGKHDGWWRFTSTRWLDSRCRRTYSGSSSTPPVAILRIKGVVPRSTKRPVTILRQPCDVPIARARTLRQLNAELIPSADKPQSATDFIDAPIENWLLHHARMSNDPSSATRPMRAFDCNRDAMAGFAAAHG